MVRGQAKWQSDHPICWIDTVLGPGTWLQAGMISRSLPHQDSACFGIMRWKCATPTLTLWGTTTVAISKTADYLLVPTTPWLRTEEHLQPFKRSYAVRTCYYLQLAFRQDCDGQKSNNIVWITNIIFGHDSWRHGFLPTTRWHKSLLWSSNC